MHKPPKRVEKQEYVKIHMANDALALAHNPINIFLCAANGSFFLFSRFDILVEELLRLDREYRLVLSTRPSP